MAQFYKELKDLRISKEISLEDLESKTKINVKYLNAIEQGDFDILPTPYLRLFIRAYAVEIGGDAERALEQLDSFVGNNRSTTATSQIKNTDKDENKINENFINPFKVKSVDGFAMLLNVKKINQINNFKNFKFFDENIFLYLENDDFCKRLVDHNEEIYVVPKSKINHLGGKAVSQKFSEEVELSRNWHWIWSKFYFNRKHKGYFFALINGLPTFISAVLKYVLYFVIFNPKKSKIYLHRAMGYLNAAMGRKSFFRPNIKI